MNELEIRQNVIDHAVNYLGCSKGDTLHKNLVDTYNSNCRGRNGARSYTLTYRDSYCASAISAWWFLSDVDSIVPYECGAGELTNLAKARGIWKDKSFQPGIGDVLVFDLKKDGWPDHVAMIESIGPNGEFNTINPNGRNGQTIKTTFNRDYNGLIGFICPEYYKLVK